MTATELAELNDVADEVMRDVRRDFTPNNDEDMIGALALMAAEERLECRRLRKILADVPLRETEAR